MVCADANNVPPGATWRRVLKHTFNQNKDDIFLSMSCMHCKTPPCLEACPTKATYKMSNGIVDINLELCVGCGACILACPYMARSISREDKVNLSKNSNENIDRIGKCTKCDFCFSHINNGIEKGLRPGIDAEATPLCVRFCIAEAIQFGDLDDPESNVSKLIEENRTFQLNRDINTDPSVFYILE